MENMKQFRSINHINKNKLNIMSIAQTRLTKEDELHTGFPKEYVAVKKGRENRGRVLSLAVKETQFPLRLKRQWTFQTIHTSGNHD